MALGPIDYTAAFGGTASPAQALTQGAQFGAQLGALTAQRQKAEADAALQQQVLQRQQDIQQAVSSLFAKPNPTARDFAQVASLMPEKEAASLRSSFDLLDKERRGKTLLFSGQVMTALQSSQPQIGIDMLTQRAEAERNAGRPDLAKAFEDTAKAAQIDPNLAFRTVGTLMASLGEDGQKALDAISKVNEEGRKADLFGPQYRTAIATADKAEADAKAAGVTAEFAPRVAAAGLTKAQSEAIKAASDAKFADQLNQAGLNERNWNVRNVQNQINVRSEQLKLDREKVKADVELSLARIGEIATSLPEQAKKDINTAAVAAGTAKQQAVQFNSLASKLEEAGGGFGVVSQSAEWFKKATGTEGYVTQLRQEFNRLRNSAAVQALPQGPATDKDIALVLKGFPESTANAATMASFLRGMAKLQDITSATENARVDWLASNRGSLGRAQTAFPAGDFAARPGETWVDMSSRIAQEINNRYAAGAGGAPQQPAAAIPGAPVQPGQVAPAVGTPRGLGGAMPGVPAPTMNIRQQADAIIQGR